jgi:hypothetical protein
VHVKGSLSIVAAIIAAVVLVSGSGAGTGKIRSAVRIDVSSRTAVVHYLRSIHVNPRGVVIQRGRHNYAGARCPGKGWSCTSTRHAVVQVGRAGGKNAFSCSSSSCAVVQIATAATTTNTAKCIKTTGLSSSCTINQTSSTANNKAVVIQTSTKTTGFTQTASYSAAITQKATGDSSVHNNNTACVFQKVNIDSSSGSKRLGTPVVATSNATQTATITQDSLWGNNLVQSASPSSSDCGASGVTGYGSRLLQQQLLTSNINASGRIEQYENASATAPNLALTIAQNKSQSTPAGSSGTNDVSFVQDSNLSAYAGTTAGPVIQKQSTTAGGLVATVNQFAHGVSTSDALQKELQCQHAVNGSVSSTTPVTCTTGSPITNLTQNQHGPVRKGDGPSVQGDNANDVFTIDQTATLKNDLGGTTQTNTVQADCTTSGGCTADQTTTNNTTTTNNFAAGQDVNSGIDCTSQSSCTATAPPTPTITSKPPDPSDSSSASFSFTDSDPTVTFLCKLDESAYSSCTSPQPYSDLGDGSHTFSVKAHNPTSGADSNAASYTWTITTANTDLITNGSFEADPFNYNGTLNLGSSNPLTGWTTSTSGQYPWGLPSPNVYNAGPTPYGNQWVMVGNQCDQGTSSIEQTINTTVGQAYTLSFALASEEGGSGAQVVVSFPTGSSTASQTFTAPPRVANFWDTWATSSMDFTATGTSATIRFTSVPRSETEGCDAGIDNVSVTVAATIF